ncbi:hypothetical protein FD967_00490 [Polynucleobacter sp. JS-Mosq-20-D10]|uniref:type VI secretion system transmembrane protein TssO n=1 Tax=Polynucleobacter sp. JS-Mosq-20-D10 TaxID=2576922 RepID=UPI001BFDA46C|nr:type VI secretion system transmembrane protein TssO [Polynucleobacter sp. JS-Mosq-20-D10]QWE00560.1 hypothetical protein FD967_00490 [Polynucleobacter sp. JS-Mosq-20-D10]
MPPRHISPQSFDDILSELGDDPAIPDPHGIRKTASPPRMDASPQTKTPKPSFSTKTFEVKWLNLSPIWIFGSTLLLCGVSLFFFFESSKSGSEQEINTLQRQLLALKEELESSQNEWHSEREDLYEVIDEIEVSIHSINTKPLTQATQSKPTAIPYEAELRRWRYLGITRMGALEQAFFHTGQSTKMVGKGDLALGEWHLTQAEKELAILTHPKGKSITFKSTNSE